MDGVVRSIWRHPVKGFTPEALDQVRLAAGACFPFDRMFAVEDGPCGFDPHAPRFISKQKFTVLAKIPAVARVRTRFIDADGVLEASFPGAPTLRARLCEQAGRDAFAAWLTEVLGDEVRGPLKVLPAPGAHRFMDDVEGFVSIVNLASVRALSEKLGRPVDPRRFRANIYVEGWPPWAENDAAGGRVSLGEAQAEVVKTIVRCMATHVDPDSGERDIDLVGGLFEHFGHRFCGIYARVTKGGQVRLGDRAGLELAQPAVQAVAAG